MIFSSKLDNLDEMLKCLEIETEEIKVLNGLLISTRIESVVSLPAKVMSKTGWLH